MENSTKKELIKRMLNLIRINKRLKHKLKKYRALIFLLHSCGLLLYGLILYIMILKAFS